MSRVLYYFSIIVYIVLSALIYLAYNRQGALVLEKESGLSSQSTGMSQQQIKHIRS